METAMPQIIYISSSNKATIICPACGNATFADVSKYASSLHRITINCRCKCKHQFKVTIERRHHYRKETNLPGTFSWRLPNGEFEKGRMRVINISFSGLMLQLNIAHKFDVGESLQVSFHLDDKHNSLYEKEVIICHVNQNLVGGAFVRDQDEDPILGYYLKK